MQMADQQLNLGFDFLSPLAPAFCDHSLVPSPMLSDQNLTSTSVCDNGVPSPHSEILESLASSPLLSPSPVSVASPYSTESGIEDDADMEDCSVIDMMQTDFHDGSVNLFIDVPLCSTTTLPLTSQPVSAPLSPSNPKSRSSTSSRQHSRGSSQEKTIARLASVQQELENLINKVTSSHKPSIKTEGFSICCAPMVNAVTGLEPFSNNCPVSVGTCTSQDQVLLSNAVTVNTAAVTTSPNNLVSSVVTKTVASSLQNACVVGKVAETPKLVILEEPEEVKLVIL